MIGALINMECTVHGSLPSCVYRKWDSWVAHDFCLSFLQSFLSVVARMVPRHFPFLHTLGNMSYLAPFGRQPLWQQWDGIPLGLTCISRMISGIEHCFLNLLATCVSSLEQYIFESFAHCLIGWLFDFAFCYSFVTSFWMLTLLRYMACKSLPFPQILRSLWSKLPWQYGHNKIWFMLHFFFSALRHILKTLPLRLMPRGLCLYIFIW